MVDPPIGRTPFPEWDDPPEPKEEELLPRQKRMPSFLYWWIVIFLALVIANIIYDMM